MSLELALLLLLFLGLLLLPLLPGLVEAWRPRDDAPMPIDPEATIAPRESALAFRRRVAGLIEAREGAGPPGSAEDRARPASCEIHRDLRLAPGSRAPALLIVLGDADIADQARVGELYVRGHARVGAGVRATAIAADGDLVLGAACVVEEWTDTEANAWIGPRCDLGRSVTAGKGLTVGPGCRFRRLWGLPLSSEAGPPASPVPPVPPIGEPDDRRIDDGLIWAGRRMSVPGGYTVERDLIVHGEVVIGPGTVVRGSIKAHGPLRLGRGVQVEGNLICRRSIHIASEARIRGHVHAEGDVVVGPGTRIGQADAFKTLYAGGRIELRPNVVVFGWTVAERAGVVTP